MFGDLLSSAVDLVLPSVPSRFGAREVRVSLMPSQPDGLMTWGGINYLFIGTRPHPPLEQARRDARCIVRKGLRDVLEWLGEEWYNEPTGAEVLQALKRGVDPMKVVNKHVSAM